MMEKQWGAARTWSADLTGRLARLALVCGAATALVVAGTGTAEAAPELLTKASCRALADPPNIQATFSVNDGYRTCTVVNTYDESLGIFQDDTAENPETDPESGTVYYLAEWENWITIRYTQVYKQRATETWDMKGADEVLDEWLEKRCYVVDDNDVREAVDYSECESRDLNPPDPDSNS
jgi:hypothetical protein